MLQCFLGLLSDYPHSQGELSAEGLFGASDLLSDLRCNGVHCREQLWKRWKSSATHKGRGVGSTGFSVAQRHTRSSGHKQSLPLIDIMAPSITRGAHSSISFLSNTIFSPNPHINIFLSATASDAAKSDRCSRWSVVTFTTGIVLRCHKHGCALKSLNKCISYRHCHWSVLQLCPPNKTGKVWQVSPITRRGRIYRAEEVRLKDMRVTVGPINH